MHMKSGLLLFPRLRSNPPITQTSAILTYICILLFPLIITALSNSGSTDSIGITSRRSNTNRNMRRILVTGGNKGIGKAICSRLLSEWDDTYILLGSRNRERGEQAIAELTSELGEERCRNRLELIEIDTSSDESMANAADVFRHKTTVVGEVEELRQDVLYGIINNAGVMSRSNDSKEEV